ncbi:hypothetical protein [uncultured Sunxiuqinia sp.]|uniref:hypothetical protein n=1 Tax=uncultured Sunxiuqinia sp. TaxID=1573825 RepID=UPI0030DC72E3
MKQIDKNFRELMKTYQPEKSPGDFTVHVMNRIYAETNRISEYKPVLNKWVLRIVYAFIGGFVVYSMFNSGSGSIAPGGSKLFSWLPKVDLSEAVEAGNKITGILGGLPQYMVVIFLSTTFLLLLDQWILKRKHIG